MSEDLSDKLALLKAKNSTEMAKLEARSEQRKQEILLQNTLRANEAQNKGEMSLEAIRLLHQLDPEKRERDREDTLFYKNLDLQELIKAETMRQGHRLEEIHHTTFSSILEQAILMIVRHRLEDKERASKHLLEKDKKSHDTKEQMKLEKFRAVLAVEYGEAKADDMIKILAENREKWDKGG